MILDGKGREMESLTLTKCWLFVIIQNIYICLWYTVFVPDFVQFPDAKSGEWFGYLTQEGKIALDFKGGPFKGKNKLHGWNTDGHCSFELYFLTNNSWVVHVV